MNFIRWLSKESNSRAILTLLAIGAFMGSGVTYLANNVIPIANPEFAIGSFGDGYRAGSEQAKLSLRIEALESRLLMLQETQKIRAEVENMAEAQIGAILKDDL